MQVTTVGGRKARYRRGGFATREAAAAARQAILDGPADRAAAGAWTVARWLRYWLAQAEPHLRPSTLHGYRDHIDRYLIPSIGRITLADLTGKRLQACFSLLTRQRTKKGTLIAPATVDRVRATLRSALNAAVREGLIPSNPLTQVRLDKPVRPHPVIWTDERVEAWRRDGIRPPVAVWTLRQLITFLIGVENDRLAALWWLIALRGLRRGEAAALDRDDLDSEACELTISRQLVALPGELYCGPPKSRASYRTSPWTRRAPGGWSIRPSGRPPNCSGTSSSARPPTPAPAPGQAGDGAGHVHLRRRTADPARVPHPSVPPDLQGTRPATHPAARPAPRAATLALASHSDLKVIQQMLGHSSIVTTADTYANLGNCISRARNRRSAAHRIAGTVFRSSRCQLCDLGRPDGGPFRCMIRSPDGLHLTGKSKAQRQGDQAFRGSGPLPRRGYSEGSNTRLCR